MKMVIGGACQGKTAYAKKLYPEVEWSDGAVCALEEIFTCKGVVHFHTYIRRWMEENMEETAEHLTEKIKIKNPNLIIVTDEIGYGLVPIEASDRAYREKTGRICTILASCSERVDRVVCGIGMRIK